MISILLFKHIHQKYWKVLRSCFTSTQGIDLLVIVIVLDKTRYLQFTIKTMDYFIVRKKQNIYYRSYTEDFSIRYAIMSL